MTDWRPIETAPKGQQVLLYFPAETGRNPLNEWIKLDRYPVGYPRQPTHWMPMPAPPKSYPLLR